jgi:hypothetical protein
MIEKTITYDSFVDYHFLIYIFWQEKLLLCKSELRWPPMGKIRSLFYDGVWGAVDEGVEARGWLMKW